MKTKKYKLLKDIPQCDVGTMFIKYKENAIDYLAEGIEQYNEGNGNYEKVFFLDCHVENNPEWFEEIKERIEVVDIKVAAAGELFTYSLILNEPIPEDKLPLIKKAVEFVLNTNPKSNGEQYADMVTTFNLINYSNNKPPTEKLFTQEQVEFKMKQTWEAANTRFEDLILKYPTFEDYLKSIQ